MVPRFTLAVLVLFALAPLASAQDAQPLRPGDAITHDLASDGSHPYTLTLAADQFVLGDADQHTVDVVITVTDPEGETVRRFDTSPRGPESFQFTTNTAGDYTITVTPFEEQEGRYTMRLDRIEAAATTPEGIVDQQFAVLENDHSPGAVVAIVERGELVFAKPYGMANLAYGLPYTLDTPTNIGSTSKQFTAFAITLLADQGHLSLDDDVRTHIPELPDLGETVTLRHLLTHTSGYREFLNALAMGGRQLGDGDPIDRSELIAVVQRQPALQNAPGTEWNYNNTAFGLLAMVVERVTGETFPDWMRANVFEPLGMTNTYVRASPAQIIPNRAQGYVPAEHGGWQEAVDLGGAMGAGGIYSTAPDLARWMDNYRTATLGGPDVIAQMTTPYVLADGDTTNYGFGLFIDEMRGLQRFQHGGADTAHRSNFGYLPEIESGLIVLTNSPTVPGSTGRIVEAFFGEHLAPEADDEAPPTTANEVFDPASFDPETLNAYAGRYEMEEVPGFILTFRRDGDQFFAQATGQPEFELFPVSPTRFELRVVDAQVTFHPEDDGSVNTITLHQNGDHPANRLPDAETAAPDLAAYTGRYYSDELETFYTLTVKEGDLHLMHRRMDEPVTLTHSRGDEFTGSFPIATLAFERGDDGTVTGFRAGNGRTRDVWFEKAE
ncbi:MAG: serine hydrolase [Rhodothermaceae bacterium]|nr:serine hydrolase [Rhodothermaceae bacterium]